MPGVVSVLIFSFLFSNNLSSYFETNCKTSIVVIVFSQHQMLLVTSRKVGDKNHNAFNGGLDILAIRHEKELGTSGRISDGYIIKVDLN
jgi:hypothetical protein